MPAKALISPRKSPKQARSQATVDTILDAAARVLVEEGYEGATTNRIAERAGVSVGSLYQYFPNRDALVAALAQRHELEMLAHLGRMASELADAPLEEAVRTYVKAMVAIHAAEPKLHHALTMGYTKDLEAMLAFQARAESVVRLYLENHREKLRPKSVELAAYLLVTSVEAICHVAVLGRPEMLQVPDFAEEVTQLVVRYLVKPGRKPG